MPPVTLTESEQKLLAIILRDHGDMKAIWLSDTAGASKEIGCSEAHVKKMLARFEDKHLLRKVKGRRGIYDVPRSPLHTQNGAAPNPEPPKKEPAARKKNPPPNRRHPERPDLVLGLADRPAGLSCSEVLLPVVCGVFAFV